MAERRVAVLGGGNTGFSLAANLQLRGFAVTLWEIPAHADTLAPLKEGAIRLTGVAEQGMAHLHHVTTDIAETLAANDLLLVPVPSYAHRAFAAACVPHLRPGHVIVLTPGNMGALAFAEAARAAGTAEGVIFAEADTAPYVCRKLGPDHAHIWGVVSGLGVAGLPGAGERPLAGSARRSLPRRRAPIHTSSPAASRRATRSSILPGCS